MTETIFHIVGGLALFLYGLHLLSGGFKKFAGPKLKNILSQLTSNPAKGAGVGAFITAVIQSSSIMVVTLIGLLNAGLLNLKQSIGVMLGAEVGTTVTAQLIAFKVGLYALPLIAFGFCLYFFTKRRGLVYAGQILLGFGILFLGMNFMSQGVGPLGQLPFFQEMLVSFSQHIFWGVLAGMVFTAVVQSSSATTGLVIAMGLEGVITLPAAIALMLGANLGTCVTGFLAAFRSSLNAKRLALAQFFKNTAGVLVLAPFIVPFAGLVEATSGDLARQIANAHTVFNLGTALALIPLAGGLKWLTERFLPGQSAGSERGAKFLDDRVLITPSLALLQAQKEINRMADLTRKMLGQAQQLVFHRDKRLKEVIEEKESCVDELHHLIDRYLAKISVLDLSEDDSQKVMLLMHSATDIERVADHAHNLAQLSDYQRKHGIRFSSLAREELSRMFRKSRESFKYASLALEKGDRELARRVLKLEKEVNQLDEQLQASHHARLREGVCCPDASPAYLEVVHNLERISDHSENIASGLLTGF